MSTKASTAALDRFGQRLLLSLRRVSRRPASGQALGCMNGLHFEFAVTMQELVEEQEDVF
jgi:hypothetical protein